MNLQLIESHRSFNGEQRKYRHESKTLHCAMTFSLYLPPNPGEKPTPLIWWLSGLTCTDDNFSQKSGFQQLAAKHQVAVLIPDTSPRGENVADDDAWDLGQGASFYLNATAAPWAINYQMYTYLLDELSAIAKPLIPHFSGQESIMGHSMGGHGALVIGLKNPERFKSISAFAPILNPSQVPWGQKAFRDYLGENTDTWTAWDAAELIKSAGKQPILISQGTADVFYPDQLDETTFLANAKNSPAQVVYQQEPDYDHSYFFIATFLAAHFDFHRQHLS